ncbi:hypothetical protein D9M71_437780 [compost metagenome]
MVADGLGVGGLVMTGARVVGAAGVGRERGGQGVAHGDHVADRPFDVHALFDIGTAERVEAGAGDLAQQRRIADDESYLRVRPQVEGLGRADADAQRQLQGQQLRGQVGFHAYLLVTWLDHYRSDRSLAGAID